VRPQGAHSATAIPRRTTFSNGPDSAKRSEPVAIAVDMARRSDEGGEVTLVGLGMLLAVVAVAYLAWMWIPVYVVHYEAQQVVRQAANEATKNPDDAQLIARMLARLRGLGRQTLVGEDGERREVPVVDVSAEDVTWERSSEQHQLHVAFDYRRGVPYPLLARVRECTMSIDLTMDISAPDWATAR
jgi:hypothetical protein